MGKPKKKFCSICGTELPKGELGFNPEPFKPYTSGTCCVKCYRDKVLPLRLQPDPHKKTAKKIFNTEEVNNEQRRLAKTINFGIMYRTGGHNK